MRYCVHIVLLLISTSTLVFASTTLVLRAHRGKATIWKDEIIFSDPSGCKINGKSSDSKSCDEIRLLLSTLNQQNSKVNTKLPPMMDEPDYEFIYESKTYPVRFQGPEVCSIDKVGIMICSKAKLSGPQKMLLLLRKNHVPRR